MATTVLGNEKPKLHASKGDLTWTISPRVLEFIASHVPADARTLETGAGLSTAFFAGQGYEHTAVTMVAAEEERIRAYCAEQGIDDTKLRFVIAPSDVALPTLQTEPLDFFLVDGGHGYPLPQIDWYYGSKHLKVGGIVGIDDIQLYSIRMLVDFLRGDDSWEYIGTVESKTAFFRLTKPFVYKEWLFQPYILKKSKWIRKASQAKRLLGYVRQAEWHRIKGALAYRRQREKWTK